MQFVIQRAFLEQLLNKASAVVVRSQVAPLLHTFLLEVKEKTLEVVRTDGDLSIVAQTDAVKIVDREPPVQVLVQAEQFYDLVKFLEGDDVRVHSVEKGKLIIESGAYKGEWLTKTMSKDWKEVKPFAGKNVIRFNAKQFVDVLDKVSYAAAHEGIHQDLMQLIFANGKCWATDWHRYQEMDTGLPKNLHFNLSVGALDLAKFIRLASVEEVEFEEGEEFYFFQVGSDRFLCNIPRTPPADRADYTKLLSKEKQGYFTVDVRRLINLVKRVRLTSPNNRRIFFEVQDTLLKVCGKSEEMGSGEESLRIRLAGYPNVKTKFSLDWEFLLESLSVINDKSIEIRIASRHVLLCGSLGVGIIGMVPD